MRGDQRDQGDQQDQLRGAAVAPPAPATNGNGNGPAPRPAERHDALFKAVCEACGFDTVLLNAIDRANVGKLARDLARASPAWEPDDVRLAGREWASVRWRRRRPSEVRPPTVAQLRSWLGECEVRWNGEAEFDEVVLR